MTILVTGGAGFIGSHLVEAFLAEGHAVSVMDDLSTGRESNLHSGAKFLWADIRDAGPVDRIFGGGRFMSSAIMRPRWMCGDRWRIRCSMHRLISSRY